MAVLVWVIGLGESLAGEEAIVTRSIQEQSLPWQSLSWHHRVGSQRDWVWRGWQTRYTYLRAADTPTANDNTSPLILLHGFGASLGHWRHNLPALAKHHTVYALDLLGFGASQKTHAPYDVAFWAEQVYDFWQTFVGQPVVLVGNSVGSMVCLTVAAKYPQMVKGLVMINLPDSSVLEVPAWLQKPMATLSYLTGPLLNLTKTIVTSPVVFSPFFRLIRSTAVLRLWAKQAYATPAAVTDELLEILASPTFDRGAVRALRAMIHKRSPSERDYSARTVLPQINMPMLLLWGDRDMMVPPKLAPLFVKYNPQLQFVSIENAGHCPHDEHPEVVNQLILQWLKEQSDTQ